MKDRECNYKNIKIRPAHKEDISQILSLIKELAEYEGIAAISATEESLGKYIFDEKYAECIIVEYMEKPAGYALFFYNFNSFFARPGLYIRDIYVKEHVRNKSLGTLMFKYLANFALDRDFTSIDWDVLKWNRPSIAFYKKIGGKQNHDCDYYSLNRSDLEKLVG